MSAPNPIRARQNLPAGRKSSFRWPWGIALLFGILLSLTSFDLPLNPETNQQLFFSLPFRTDLSAVRGADVCPGPQSAEAVCGTQAGVLGSKFRTRLVVGSLLLSFLPVIGMFCFAYVLMNRSIDKWFSSPVEEVRRDTATMASLLSKYAAQNARAEAESIAASPETQAAFASHNFSAVSRRIPSATRRPCKADSRWRS